MKSGPFEDIKNFREKLTETKISSHSSLSQRKQKNQ